MTGKAAVRMDDWALPEVDRKKCVRCGLCVERCPTHAVTMADLGPVFVDVHACTYCGDCEVVCPEDAISLYYVITWDSGDRLTGVDKPEVSLGNTTDCAD